jgi:hypothetical protein
MKTLKDFTPEVKAKIPDYIKLYTAGVFDGGRYNSFAQKDAEELIHWNYETAGYKKPVVLVAENPYESQIFFNYITANKEIFGPVLYAIYCLKNGISIQGESGERSQLGSQLYSQLDSQLYSQLGSQLGSQLDSQLYSQLDSQLYSQLGSQLDSQLYSQLDSQLGSQLYSQLYSQLGSQLGSQLDSQLYSQLDSQLYSQLGSQLDSQLYSQLGSQLGSYNADYLFTANVYSNTYAGYYKFIAKEFQVDAPINVVLNSWNDLYQKSGVYSAIFSELVCVVSKYPKMVDRNAANDLHSLTGPAVEWGISSELTKFECYYINGRPLPRNHFEAIKGNTFTLDAFLNEGNEEVKSTCIAFMQELHGDEFLLNFFGKFIKEIDTYVDKKKDKYLEGTTRGMQVGVYTLFNGEVNGANVSYVRCYCPSTDRMFFLGVDPIHKNAKDAIASLYRVPKKLRNNIKYIQRQGERFSTVFDDHGTGLLSKNKLSEDEISDTTTITGNEYFSLLTYEY